MQFTIFQESRKGARRTNQDRIAYTYGRDTLLLVVADGMGGHVGGDIAAQICVRLFIERFQREAKPVLKNPFRFLQDSMTRAHEALGSYANQFSMIETPRTTCVACVVQAGHAYWAHVGDSRLYLYRRGRLVAETRDHSKVQYLVDQGFISAQEAVTHPERNRIFSCLGGLTEPTVDLGQRTLLEEGDLIVLCTDGFWSTVKKEEIAGVLADAPVLEASPALMAEAERRGGDEGDNVSAIIVRWGPEIVPEEPSTTTTTTTETMRLGEFETQLDRTLTLKDADAAGDLTEEEIERAIDDIQATIRRYRR
jgi:PPM family protein phosphatase